MMPSADRESRWAKSNGWYQNVIYDSELSRYYRLYRLPLIEGETDPRTCVMVFDKEMKKLGEVMLSSDYMLESACVFVHDGGLHIRIQTDSEDYLSFAYFDTASLL